jgi:hypothetical protein
MEERVMVDGLGMNALDGTIKNMLYSLSVDVTDQIRVRRGKRRICRDKRQFCRGKIRVCRDKKRDDSAKTKIVSCRSKSLKFKVRRGVSVLASSSVKLSNC